jgi:hypothetical protein
LISTALPPAGRDLGSRQFQRLSRHAEIVNPLDREWSPHAASCGTRGGPKGAAHIASQSEGMSRSFLLIATVSLAASLSIGCYAQESATADTTQISREEWQAQVRASRERLDLMRRERKSLVAPPPTQDEIAEAGSKRVLEDDLRPGDIVSTKAGLFRFRGSPDRERKPQDFERIR